MPISCHVPILASLPLILGSCATSTALVHAPEPSASGPAAIEFERDPPKPARAPSPYAPTRAGNSPRYSWQSAMPKACAPEASARQAEVPVVLSFSGSVGVFPPLPDEVTDPPPAQSSAPSTWGSGTPAPEVRSADLVVAALRPAFRRCFSRWLEAKADAEGSVRLALELGCGGEVQAISADVQGVDEPTLECLFTVVGPAQFVPPAGGHATLQVPVVFKNAAR